MNKACVPVLFQPETSLPDSRAFSAEADIAMAHFLEMLQQLEQSLQGKDDTIQQQSRVIEELKQRIATLESYLRLARSQTYGRSSEKSQGQWDIFNEMDAPIPDEETPEADTHEPKPRANKKGRKPLPAHLPRHQVFAELTDEEKKGALTTFFRKSREELDIIPPVVRVLEYMQEVAVFPACPEQGGQQQLKLAALPKHPIPKSAVSIAMLTWIIIAKFCDALPLYRQERILGRYGGSLSRTTMANTLIRLSKQLQPLINLLMDHLRSGPLINADETRMQVLKEMSKSINSDKFIWNLLGGPPGQPAVVFHYDPSRSKEVPLRLLEGFHGYLQTDGYAAYSAVCKQEGITQVGCRDHARRKFKDAQKGEKPPGKGNPGQKTSLASTALAKIARLYANEKVIKEATHGDKRQYRQQHSVPVLEEIKAWLDVNINRVEPGSLIHNAIGYALNQWPKLIIYCEDGLLNISNAAAENAIRPLTVGRRNWLFADTPDGARASAIYYSLIESAKANGLEPFEYICYVLKELPYADTVEKLEALLPWNVKASGALSRNTSHTPAA